MSRPLSKMSKISEKRSRAHIQKNLSHYLKIMRCQTPANGDQKKEFSCQTQFRHVDGEDSEFKYPDGSIDETPLSDSSNKKFIIVNIANPNEYDQFVCNSNDRDAIESEYL